MDIINTYKQKRIDNNLSVREMAEIMGVSENVYRMYEAGTRNPKDLALSRFNKTLICLSEPVRCA